MMTQLHTITPRSISGDDDTDNMTTGTQELHLRPLQQYLFTWCWCLHGLGDGTECASSTRYFYVYLCGGVDRRTTDDDNGGGGACSERRGACASLLGNSTMNC
ncbi:hypothetical protein CBL_07814 [Carabus blaptoides fortunei]